MKRLLPVLILGISGCGEPVREVNEHRAESAATRDIVVAVESAGVIEPITLVEVKSKASGEILELAVESGQRVAMGDLLVKIDQRIPRNALALAVAGLDVAHARLTNSEAQMRRIQKLFAASSISEVDRETAQLDVANAKAEVVRSQVAVENAKIAMEDTVVSAPIGGTVIEQFVERGQVISSPGQDVGGGTLLMRMADLTRVRVRALVDETDIGKVTPGMAARVTVAAYPNRQFEGRVLKVEPQAAAVQNVTMFPVLVELDNEEALLKPGMNADVSLDIARRLGVLAVPVAALRTMDDAVDAAEIVGIDAELVKVAMGSSRTAEGGGSEALSRRERLQQIRAKRQQGEILTEEERSLLADARAEAQAFGGRGMSGGIGSGPGGGAPAAPAGAVAASSGAAASTGSRGAGVPVAAPAPGTEIVDPLAAARRRSALDEQFGGRYVVFVEHDGGIAPRVIDAGVTDLDYIEVASGLAAGERVLLLPSASLVRSQEGFRDRLLGRMSNPLGGRAGGRSGGGGGRGGEGGGGGPR